MAVDRFGGAVAGAGVVEVGQDVGRPFLQRPPEGDHLLQCVRDASAEGVDECLHRRAPCLAVGLAVGGHGALIDRPGGLDLGMGVDGEQCLQPGFLLVGEQMSNDQNLWMTLGGAARKWAHLPEDDLKFT